MHFKMSVLIMVQHSLLGDLNNTSGLLNCSFTLLCLQDLVKAEETNTLKHNHMGCCHTKVTVSQCRLESGELEAEERREEDGARITVTG